MPHGPHTDKPLNRKCSAIVLACFALLLGSASVAQETVDSSRFSFRPTFGVGIGMLAFYGDIGNDHSSYSPLLTRVAYELRAAAPVTEWLELSLYAMHGRVGVNERDLVRDLNFESRLTVGGFQLAYNFHHLLRPDRVVEPYVSVGFETVEFLSKTDLFDAQGRAYHYWSDGTIRDMSESSGNAENAAIIQRDYSYESDIRELDLDGFGKYDERTFAIPVGVGVRMHLGGGFSVRVGTSMHFTMTDHIDGVTEESIGARKGDARNDRFLYSSFSMNYALNLQKKKRKSIGPTLSPEEIDVIALLDDEDGDGVTDMTDECPHTPSGVAVDKRGCPLDSDGDGVPDHLDLEPGTAQGAPVDGNGVTLTDADLLKAYLNYKDSANANIVSSRAESFGPSPRKKPISNVRKYVVKVGTEVEGISEDMIDRILSIPDVRTIERGDTTYYVVGDHADIPEAIMRQLNLKAQGVDGSVMAEENGKLVDVSNEVGAAKVAMGTQSALTEAPSMGTVVRVQLGAFRKKLSKNIFQGIPDLVVIKGDDGLTRYYTGSYTDVNKAAEHKVEMLLKGFKGAFLVAFKEGRRVTLKDAGARLTGPEVPPGTPIGGIDKAMISFKIQVGTFAGNVPMDVMDKFIEIGNVTPVTSVDAVRYYYGSFPDRSEADEALNSLKSKGLGDAFVVGALGDRIIPADEAQRLLAE